jgi:hypothetical protein
MLMQLLDRAHGHVECSCYSFQEPDASGGDKALRSALLVLEGRDSFRPGVQTRFSIFTQCQTRPLFALAHALAVALHSLYMFM